MVLITSNLSDHVVQFDVTLPIAPISADLTAAFICTRFLNVYSVAQFYVATVTSLFIMLVISY